VRVSITTEGVVYDAKMTASGILEEMEEGFAAVYLLQPRRGSTKNTNTNMNMSMNTKTNMNMNMKVQYV
jgi:hypothetical protein